MPLIATMIGSRRAPLASIWLSFFFPTMVAGPIKRFQDFVPCLRFPSRDWSTDWNRGITRILVGLVKKVALADLLTSPKTSVI